MTVDGAQDVRTLVERAGDGDRQAFAALYDRYLDQVYGYIRRRVGRREVAEDLCSEVFLNALRSIGSFTWQGPDPGAWLIAIARNRLRDHYKSATVRREEIRDASTGPPRVDPRQTPESTAMGRDVALSLGRALELLSDDHREVLELRFLHELSVAETAEVMERTVGAVKALQYRALRALAEVVNSDPSFSHLAGLGGATLALLLRMVAP